MPVATVRRPRCARSARPPPESRPRPTAHRRRRSTSGGRSSTRRPGRGPTAGLRRPRWRRRPRRRPSVRPGGEVHRDAGRRLVVGEGVEVDGLVDDGLRVIAGRAGDDERLVQVRAAALASANLVENSPNTRCSLRRSIRPNVATSQNTVVPPLPSTISQPSGRRNRSARPGPQGSDERASPVAGGAMSPATVRPAATRASSCSGRTLDGPQPKRPSAGRSSEGSRNSAGVSAVTVKACQQFAEYSEGSLPCHVTPTIVSPAVSPPSPNPPPSLSTPRPRPCKPKARR